MKPFLVEKEILSENLLSPKPTAAGPVMVFSVPSSFLLPGKVYTVDLKYVNPAGKLEDLSSFTFHVVRKKYIEISVGAEPRSLECLCLGAKLKLLSWAGVVQR